MCTTVNFRKNLSERGRLYNRYLSHRRGVDKTKDLFFLPSIDFD